MSKKNKVLMKFGIVFGLIGLGLFTYMLINIDSLLNYHEPVIALIALHFPCLFIILADILVSCGYEEKGREEVKNG